MSDSTELARLVGKLEATCEMKILERDKRIAELKAKLREVANIMHHGGLMGLTDNDARRLLIPYWDQEECECLQTSGTTTKGGQQ